MQAKLMIALFVITVSGWMAWTANGWRVAADHVKADLAQAQAQLFVTQAALQHTTAQPAIQAWRADVGVLKTAIGAAGVMVTAIIGILATVIAFYRLAVRQSAAKLGEKDND